MSHKPARKRSKGQGALFRRNLLALSADNLSEGLVSDAPSTGRIDGDLVLHSPRQRVSEVAPNKVEGSGAERFVCSRYVYASY